MKRSTRSMTDENTDAWAMIAPVHQIQRLTDWANMLEVRLKEFDPDYRAYPWGRDVHDKITNGDAADTADGR